MVKMLGVVGVGGQCPEFIEAEGRQGGGGRAGREFNILMAWWMKLSLSLLVFATVTHNAECFAGQACAVNVLEGGNDDPLSCSYYAGSHHTVMQLVRMLSVVPQKKVCMMGTGALALFSLRRK